MTEELAGVQGFVVGYRSTADGTLTFTVALDEYNTELFHECKMGKGCAVTVARMSDGSPSAS